MNLVRMMIELEDLDLNNFKNAWEMAQAIKAENKKELAEQEAQYV